MKRTMTLVVLLAMLLISINATTAQMIDIPDELPDGITIEYWHEWDGAQQVGIDAVIDSFHETNEWGITVEQVQLGSTGPLLDELGAGIVSGELPNIAGAIFASNVQGFYLDNVIVPLDEYMNHPVWGMTDEELADLNEGLVNVNRIGGEPFNNQLFAWPIGLSAVVMSTNIGMLEDLGFDGPPTDLATFREVACAANDLETDNGDVQGFPIRISATDMYAFIRSNGGIVFDEEQGYVFTDDATLEVLQFFQDLFNDGCAYIPDGRFVNTADFAFGLNPMAVGSSVGVPFIKGDIEDSGSGVDNWINTTTPWSEGNRMLLLGARSVGLITSSPEEQLATWLFMKHMATTESQIAWTENAQYQPFTYSGLEGLSDEFLEANPQFSSIREAMLDPNINAWAPPIHLNTSDVTEAVDSMIVDITTGGVDVAEAAAEAEETANEIYEEALEELE